MLGESSKAIDIDPATKEYLQKIKLNENDPALVINWRDEDLAQFVHHANQPAALPHWPIWITSPPGNMNSSSLKQNIVTILAEAAGGLFLTTCLGPNSTDQFIKIGSVLGKLERLPLFEHVMPLLGPNAHLAVFGYVTDRSMAKAVPIRFAGPAFR